MRHTVRVFALLALVIGCYAARLAAKETPLRDGWMLQSACKLSDAGAAISSADYRPVGWLAATIPATVLAAQVTAGIYKDVYYGLNLRSIPGASYPIGENFSNLPMPADSPYRCGWWYRKQFSMPAAAAGSRAGLQFEGINYSAEVWVNGKRIADASQIRGAYRNYEFDVSDNVRPGAGNVVAVQVFAPTEKSLGMNWVDWNPMPPDKDMGLWSDVKLVTNGPVSVRHTAVFTHFEDDTLQSALLTVVADLHNLSASPIHGEVIAEIAGRRLSQQVTVPAGETLPVAFHAADFPQLKLSSPHIWWPADYGAQPLQNAAVRFVSGGRLTDQEQIRFGVREMTSEITAQGHRLFRVNGKPILIRGGGWAPDMMLRSSPERLRQEFELVRDLHLNTIRLEGKMESDDFFQLADEQGILVMAGWCCCDYWEKWTEWSTADIQIAAASLESQLLRMRSHPSLLAWIYGSDNPPPAEVENRYRQVIAETLWPNPVLSSASATPTSVTGASGVKMSGPYDYVAPSYWYQDTSKFGGAFGFNTETGPGAAPEQVAELKRFLPESALWPPDNPTWNFHAGGEEFKTLGVFNRAMSDIYGVAQDVDSYSRVAQTMAYDSERAMFESYSGHRYTSTGVVQWMLNNAWPSLIWHLYDYYLVPGGGYYGVKKANEPLHIQYAYDQQSVVVVNSTLADTFDLEATVEVLGPDLKPMFTKTATLDMVRANSSQVAVAIPASAWSTSAPFCFVSLSLAKGGGVTISRNVYWVPSALTTFDWAKTTFVNTPAKTAEDLSALRKLPQAKIDAQADSAGDQLVLHIANHSQALAFQLAAEAYDDTGNLVPLMLWSDNYIEVLPGESTVLSAAVPASYAGRSLTLRLSGWNVAPWEQKIALTRRSAAR